MKLQLSEIAKAVHAQNSVDQWANEAVSSVSFDSRALKAGALFVPLMGQTDGHHYLSKAEENGAVATLIQADHAPLETTLATIVVEDTLTALQDLSRYYLKKIDPKVVAITGSNGKTTTKDMTASILATQFNVSKTYANFNNEIGVPMTVLQMEPNTEILVVEMGMDRPGQLDFLSQLVAPDVAVITMIGEAHIEFFGTREKIADAKMEITHGLKDDGYFVYNGDEPLLMTRAAEVSQMQATFGRDPENHVYATEVEATDTTTSFKTNLDGDITFKIPLMGEYNVTNALAALSVGDLFHITPENAAKALENVDLTRNRTEWVRGDAGEQILSDVYNSNPTAAIEVIKAFEKTTATGKRLAVLGDMLELGDDADAMHASLAMALDPTEIQVVYLVGDHMKALQTALADKYDADAVHHYDADQLGLLINDLNDAIQPEDAVLLKASHGIHLETVLDALQASETE